MLRKLLPYATGTAIALLALASPAIAGSFSFKQTLTAPDGEFGDRFGKSIDVDGNYVLIGAEGDDDKGSNSGSAYLFDSTTGDLLHKLTAPDGAAGDLFGGSVAIDGNYALIGAEGDDRGNQNSGAAYLFDITTGNFLHKMTGSGFGLSANVFGSSVALNGNTALIGEGTLFGNSTAYVFDTTTGNLLRRLTAPDKQLDDLSVAIDGNYALLGAERDNSRQSENILGAGYLFDVTTGSLLQKLIPDPDGYHILRGSSVAIHEDYALISRNARTGSVGDSITLADLFNPASGELLHKLTVPKTDIGQKYKDHYIEEYSLALNGDYALISPVYYIDESAAYLFDTTTGDLLQKLTVPDYQFGDVLSIALDGDTALLSSWRDEDNGSTSLFSAPDTAFLSASSFDLLGAGGSNNNTGAVYILKEVPDRESVPEPASILGLLAISCLGMSSALKRKK